MPPLDVYRLVSLVVVGNRRSGLRKFGVSPFLFGLTDVNDVRIVNTPPFLSVQVSCTGGGGCKP